MNASAGLFVGAGAPTRSSTGSDLDGPVGIKENATGDGPDFFAVLKGTIADKRSAARPKGLLDGDEPLSAIELYAMSHGHIDSDAPIAGQVFVEVEVPIDIDTHTLEAEWLAPADNERDDRVPLLDIEVPTSESRLPLHGSGAAGDLATPRQTLHGSLLRATTGDSNPRSITFRSPTLELAATVGDSNALLTTQGPLAEAPDATKLVASVGEAAGAASLLPGVIADPDLSLVDPELRTRLERVIDRMRIEYGHNVKVVEGFRTPERQDALFAQGRSSDGPVVTWTQHSMHSEGLAVDVIVDGSYAPHEGYRRLARIAGEEGLQTLGAKDPGHLQLVDTASDSALSDQRFGRIAQVESAAVPATPAPVADVERVALRASIAEPAAVAQPAAVAMPAAVATPGEVAPASDRVPLAADPPQLAENRQQHDATIGDAADEQVATLATPGSQRRNGEELPFGQDPRNRGLIRAALRRELRGRGAEPTAKTTTESDPRLAATARSEGNNTQAAPVKTPTLVAAESLHRVTQVRELQELAYPRRLGQVTLRMLDGMTEEARMRVSLMGNGVETSIGVRDLAQANRMRSRIGTLENALRMRGLEPTSTRIGAMASATGAEASVLTAQAITGPRLAADADPFMSWQHGSGADSGRDDRQRAPNSRDDTPRPRDNRQQPQEQRQENQK